jgi:transcriptional regulator with XRE-family HTH domain
MTVFSLTISPKDADGSDAVDAVNRRILYLVEQRIKQKKTTKAKIARRLGVNRSTVSRMLQGNQNLTIRTIGELLGAIDYSLKDIIAEDRISQGANLPLDHPSLNFEVKETTTSGPAGQASTSPEAYSILAVTQ